MQELWEVLKQHNIGASVLLGEECVVQHKEEIDPWITDLFARCPVTIKDRLSVLLCDTLAGYPYSIYAVPVQIAGLCATENEAEFKTSGFYLPDTPSDEMDARACEELLFLGWAPLTSSFAPVVTNAPIYLPFGKPQCVLALFHADLELGAHLNAEIPAPWWESLFNTDEARIVLSAQYALPYPRAVEVGRLLQHSVEQTTYEAPLYFATATETAWATNSGRYFWERCVRQFPGEFSRHILEDYIPEGDI